MNATLEIEKALLGACLRGDLEVMHAAKGLGVTHEVFTHDAHRTIWQAIEENEAKIGSVDLVTVWTRLSARNEENDYLSPGYLCELSEAAPISQNLDLYARELVATARRRHAIDELGWLQRRLQTQEAFAKDDEALISAVFGRLLDQGGGGGDTKAIDTYTTSLIDTLQARVEAHGAGVTRGVSTGFPLLDKILGGWVGGRLYVVAARPNVGKTTLAVNFADAACAGEVPWAFFTLEMEGQDIVEKLASKRSRVVNSRLQSGDLRPEDIDRLFVGLKDIAKSKAFLDNRSGRYIETFEVAVRRLVRKHGVRVVFLDYIQQMRARGKWASRQAELSEITDRVKQLALSSGVAIVACAQLSREAEKSGAPLMSHLKESGSIEQDADAVVFIHRENPEAPLALIVAKNRWGRKGKVLIDAELAVNAFRQSSYNPEVFE